MVSEARADPAGSCSRTPLCLTRVLFPVRLDLANPAMRCVHEASLSSIFSASIEPDHVVICQRKECR